MRYAKIVLALGLTLTAIGCKQAASPPAVVQATEIAWREGDVDDALAEARESGKPVILYWGAKWCPPCNQMKATLFKDSAFIAETQNFVPVYLDGDSAGAQRWGEQFGISGYPTVIVLRPDGTEVTRLSSAATTDRFADLLRVAAKRTESTEALLAKAEKDPASLGADDWRLLGDFDWQNDPKHFGDTKRAGALLGRLAAATPDPVLKRRFTLLALVITAEEGKDGKAKLNAAQQSQVAQVLPAIFGTSSEVTANRQELIYSAAPLIAGLSDAAKRQKLAAGLQTALDALSADKGLALTERLGTVYPDIQIVKAENGGKVPAAVLDKVRSRVAWADKSAKDPVERQSVISDAATFLYEAGDKQAARTLLLSELDRSKWAYYYMLDLAGMAEDSGNKAEAIDWAHKAYEAAQGPATRVQWAISWSNMVLRAAPENRQAVEASAAAVIDELGKNPDSYFQRTRVKVTAWGEKVRAWSEKNNGADVLGRLQAKMAAVCARQGSEAATCGKWSRVA